MKGSTKDELLHLISNISDVYDIAFDRRYGHGYDKSVDWERVAGDMAEETGRLMQWALKLKREE